MDKTSSLSAYSAEVSTLGPAYVHDRFDTTSAASRDTNNSADGLLDAVTMAATGSARRDSTAALEYYYDIHLSLPSRLQSSSTIDSCYTTTTTTTATPVSSSASTGYQYDYIEVGDAYENSPNFPVAHRYDQIELDANTRTIFNKIYGDDTTGTSNARFGSWDTE
eukprot:UC1_evm1s544